MYGMITYLVRHNREGEIVKVTRVIADVNTVREGGIVEIEFDEENGKWLTVRFELAALVREAVKDVQS
jgi:hypothetical protein